MTTIPDGWTSAQLDELTRPISTTGKKVKTKDALPMGRYPVIDQGTDECAGYLNDVALIVPASPSSPVILFGDHTRIVKYIEQDFIPGADGTKLLRPKDQISPRYLHYLLTAADVPDRGYGRHFGQLKALALPVAPESEQQRIADKLDTVLARVDAVNDRLARVAPLLKRFRQAVLTAAMSGRLTADWREARGTADAQAALTELAQIFAVREKSAPYLSTDSPAPFLAPKKSLKDIGIVSGGLTKNSKRAELPLIKPYLRVANVHANELRLDDITSIGLTEAEFAKTRLQTNDLLIVEGNGSLDQIGRVALWDGSIRECSHQNHLIRWRANHGVDPKYVLYWLLSPEGRTQIELVAKSTTGLHTLSVSKVSALTLPVPSQEEQSEIVRRVDILFAFADRLEARLQAAQTAAGRLTPALLAKAFRGELVPQDPADEPAAELLRRLAVSAPPTPTAKRERKANAA